MLQEQNLNSTFSKFLTKLIEIRDTLTIGESNVLLDSMIERVKKQEMILLSFLKYHRDSNHMINTRSKRQVLLGGLALGLLTSFGLSEYQIKNINDKLVEINKDHLHNSNKISMLETAIKFNSEKLNIVVLYSQRTLHILKDSLLQINTNFLNIDKQIK